MNARQTSSKPVPSDPPVGPLSTNRPASIPSAHPTQKTKNCHEKQSTRPSEVRRPPSRCPPTRPIHPIGRPGARHVWSRPCAWRERHLLKQGPQRRGSRIQFWCGHGHSTMKAVHQSSSKVPPGLSSIHLETVEGPPGATQIKRHHDQQNNGPKAEPGIRAVTGVHAPESGWWRPVDEPQPFRYIQKGDVMPGLEGNRTEWELDYALPPSRRANIARTGVFRRPGPPRLG